LPPLRLPAASERAIQFRARPQLGAAGLRQQQLFEQQLLLTQTRGAELRARAELYRALGGGWQP